MDETQSRVHVTRGDHSLLLKTQDVTVARLARIFKIKPDSVYLEEDVTKNVELPNSDGQFIVSRGRYKACGDDERMSDEQPGYNGNVWNTPRSWTPGQRHGRSFLAPSHSQSPLLPSSSKPRNTTTAEQCFNFKRTIPYVTLNLDDYGKITVETTIDNVYVKIPENNLSVSSILSSIASKVTDVGSDDLVLLDAKFIPISDVDKELDFWKTPSRRFYCAKHIDFENVIALQQQRRRLSTRKRKGPVAASFSVEDSEALERIESSVIEISDAVKKLSRSEEVVQLSKIVQQFECKICLALSQPPVVITLCCNQLLGCEACFKQATEDDLTCRCPLCRREDSTAIPLRGFDGVIKELKKVAE